MRRFKQSVAAAASPNYVQLIFRTAPSVALGRRGLHPGPFQVVPESAAIAALQRAVGDRSFWIEHQGTSIVSRGTGAPLVTVTEVLRVAPDTATVRVELRAAGDGDRLCSLSTYRFRLD